MQHHGTTVMPHIAGWMSHNKLAKSVEMITTIMLSNVNNNINNNNIMGTFKDLNVLTCFNKKNGDTVNISNK